MLERSERIKPWGVTLGIVGGGQLGKMLSQSASKLGFEVVALDPSPSCPVSSFCKELIVGSLMDEEKIFELAKKSDVVTYEIEHVNTEALKKLESDGYPVYPQPHILSLINDKLKQRIFLRLKGFPVPDFWELDTSNVHRLRFPFVQKARYGGYDGRGVVVVRSIEDLDKLLNCPSYVEEFVEIEKEISVVVVRGIRGQIAVYPVVEMVFKEGANVLEMLFSPAELAKEIEIVAKELAISIVDKLDGVGVFAIEMFVTREGKIFVNEIAPRVHNSGHHTIESCVTSQFEQHIRAITGLPLGSTEQILPAAMVNLLGEPGYKGKPILLGIEEVLKIPGVHVHFYGKKETYPYRKMGHVTIVGKDINEVRKIASFVSERLKVIGDEKI